MKLMRSGGAFAAGAATSISAGYSLYLTAIGLAATSRLGRSSAPALAAATQQTRFRILIPAHEEELLIKDTIAAVLDVNYPVDRYEVHVVADNCTDRTAAIAEDAGATVHARVAPENPGKGPALIWLLQQLEPGEPRDVIIVLDADTIVDPNVLNAFDCSFDAGASVVQGQYAVRGVGEGGEVDLRSAAFAVRHLVRPAGRVELGGSSSLYGNGMAFTEEIARNFAWSSHLTEDLEMGLRLLLAGETVEFAPAALVRGEMPDTLDGATSQHERWESGRRSVANTFVPPLVRAALAKKNDKRWAYMDATIDITMPPLGSLVALTAAGTLGAGVFAKGPWRRVGVLVGITSGVLQVAHVLTSLKLADAPKSVYRSLLRAPLNILWKLGLLAKTFRDTPDEWVRTRRNTDQPTTTPSHSLAGGIR